MLEILQRTLDALAVMGAAVGVFYLFRNKVPERYRGPYTVAWILSPMFALAVYDGGAGGALEFVFAVVQLALILGALFLFFVLFFN